LNSFHSGIFVEVVVISESFEEDRFTFSRWSSRELSDGAMFFKSNVIYESVMSKCLLNVALSLAALCFSCSTGGITKYNPSEHPSLFSQVPLTVAQAETSLIMRGDSIAFSVWGYPEFTTRSVVKPSGTITVPLIGEIMAADYTRDQFDQHLRRKLAEFIQGEVHLTLEIVKPVSRIVVLGAVGKQGSFPAPTDLPLLEVLSNAGTWTEDADLRYLRIIHQSRPAMDGGALEVDLQAHFDSGDLRTLPMVHPGDVVFVPKKENAVRQIGAYLGDAFLLFYLFRLFY
jgi:polysaccharide export outer membrane protein